MSAAHKRPSRVVPYIVASLMLATSVVLVTTRGEGLSTLVAVGLFGIGLVLVAMWRRSVPEHAKRQEASWAGRRLGGIGFLIVVVGVIYPPRLVLILLGGAVLMAGSELSIRAGRGNQSRTAPPSR